MDGVRENPEQGLCEEVIALENACYDAVRRDGLTLAMHLCRGSRASSLPVARVATTGSPEHLFHRLHVDRFLLEYDNSERVGGFEPLRHVPKARSRCWDSSAAPIRGWRSQDDLLRRIEASQRVLPVEQLAISSQCGFQGSGSRDWRTHDDRRRKAQAAS